MNVSEVETQSVKDVLHNWGHWTNVLIRDELKCVYCGLDGSANLHAFRQLVMNLDHLVPRSKGGGENEENLVTCCWPCNRGKSNYDPRNGNPNASREEMIKNAKWYLEEKDWGYYRSALSAFNAKLNPATKA